MNPKISKKLQEKFEKEMHNKWKFSSQDEPWYYEEDLQNALFKTIMYFLYEILKFKKNN